jgi:hypothetical protein
MWKVLGLGALLLCFGLALADDEKQEKAKKDEVPENGLKSGYEAPTSAAELTEEQKKLAAEARGINATKWVPANPPSKWTSTASGMNGKVLKYCADHVKMKVGSGAAPTLAELALKAAGARNTFPARTDDKPYKDDYVWGTLVCTLKPGKMETVNKVLPGDIIQIRGFNDKPTFAGPTLDGGVYYLNIFHHTAVVEATGKGKDSYFFKTYDQDVSGDLHVHEGGLLKLKDMKGGTIWVYRPTK